jgi:HAD superfamily hydrolase (TIGR01549 family)
MPVGYPLVERRWVVLDVGETLVDESRSWATWADVLGIPRLTLAAALGASIARGMDHRDTFVVLGVDGWRDRWPEVEARYGGFQAQDLYADGPRTIAALRDAGYRVAILANQPASRTAQLRALGFDPDVMAMSDEMGVAKPDAAFFQRALELLGRPDPASVAYVGDRVDNDVLPARAAGLRAVWLRRGPWGVIQSLPDGAPALAVDSLDELVARLDEVWA